MNAIKKEKVKITGEFELEGILEYEVEQMKKACVICHPHPQFGGDMMNNVVLALSEGFKGKGFATLRFNFRGVGSSGGSYSGGVGEAEDVKACVNYLRERGFVELAISGYSFGSWVGIRAAIEEEPVFFISVALPVSFFDFSFLSALKIPLGIIAGGSDSFCPMDRLNSVLSSLRCRHEVSIIAQADHFMNGYEEEIKERAENLISVLTA